MAGNPISYGLCNVHYAIVTETIDESGKITSSYGEVKAWPGAVELAISPVGESTTVYADNGAWWTYSANGGYEGSYTSMKVPAAVYEEVFGMQRTTNGLLVENADDKPKAIALLYEVETNERDERFCFFNCNLERPNAGSKTTEASVSPEGIACNIKILPRPDDHAVKCCADAATAAEAHAGFFNSVPELAYPEQPAEEPAEG